MQANLTPPDKNLTPRQRELLSMLARNFGKNEIAQHFGVRTQRIYDEFGDLFSIYGVTNDAALVYAAIKSGDLHPDELS
ncbi:MAG TPA: hypothetical protein VKP04_07180 [Ktedonobacteraceae bacterium]|nr:hypothetical protein [Ktedonobacteraceae bacterium]